MSLNRQLFLAAFFGGTGVILGAFGAHALKEHLAALSTTTIWDKAVHYQLLHAVAILAVALSAAGSSRISQPWLSRACSSWSIGVLLFSGSLYGLALDGPRWLGPITPLGGLAMIAGWLFVFVAGRSTARSS